MGEWHEGVVRGHLDTPTTRVGSRCTTIRRIGGPIRAVVAVRVEPLADGLRSRVTIEVDFTGPE